MGFFGTPASSLSDLGLILVQLSAISGTIAFYFMRYKRKPILHMITMFLGVLLLWSFLALYVLNYVLNGVKTFGGPPEVVVVYYPFLIIHIAGAMIMGYLTAQQMYTGLKRFDNAQEKEWAKFKFDPAYRQKHRSRGLTGVILWWFSALSGLVVYFLLYVIYSPVKV